MYDIDGTRYTGMFARTALIGIPYRDGNGDGMIDGAFPPLTADNLKLYVLNEGTAEWVLVGGTVNKAKKRVEAEVRHFSVYTLVGTKSSAQDLRGVIVYPNPCRAGAGQTGRVVFSHLTAHALLRIYTIAGELVCEAREDDSDGRYEWPLTTASGGTVASGIYIYVVTNPDNAKDKHTGKLAIIK
jgi:hypothetical protein